jgi:TMEM175 potassium channel family protein
MNKTRLEAFSDGVIAILITILVLELKVPHGTDLAALQPLAPVFLTYVLSFVMLGIYWNNHHHLLHAADDISGGVLWANLHLLFWLSLIPFVTGWMGENHFAAMPTAGYGMVLLAAAIAYTILVRAIIAHEGSRSRLGKAVGRDVKGFVSLVIYTTAIVSTLVHPGIAQALFVVVALIWLVPDRRIEKKIEDRG